MIKRSKLVEILVPEFKILVSRSKLSKILVPKIIIGSTVIILVLQVEISEHFDFMIIILVLGVKISQNIAVKNKISEKLGL